MTKEPSDSQTESVSSGTPGLAWRTLKNAIWSILEFAWPIITSILATPYIVRTLGADAYGVLSITAVTLGFFGFLDLGVGGAAIRQIAQEHERGDADAISRVLSTVLAFYLVVGTIGAVAIAIMTPWLVTSILKVPEAVQAEATLAFYVSAVGFLVSLLMGPFNSVPRAIQRFDISTRVTVVFGTVSVLAVVSMLALGFGLPGVVIAQVTVNALAVVAYYLVDRRLIPGLRVMLHIDRTVLGELLSQGVYFLVASLGVQLLYQVDKFLLGSLVSVAAVTFYVVPGNITQKIQQLLGAAAQMVFPVAAALDTRDEREGIELLYREGQRLLFLLGAAVAVPLVVFARPFLTNWMGPKFDGASVIVMMLLAVTYLCLGLTSIPWGISFGRGRARVNAAFAVGMGALDIALFFALTPRFGIVGAASAYLIAAALGMPIFAAYVERRDLGLSGATFVAEWLRPAAAAALAAVAGLLLLPLAGNLFLTLVLMAFCVVLTPALYFALRLAKPRDWRIVNMVLAKVRGA